MESLIKVMKRYEREREKVSKAFSKGSFRLLNISRNNNDDDEEDKSKELNKSISTIDTNWSAEKIFDFR